MNRLAKPIITQEVIYPYHFSAKHNTDKNTGHGYLRHPEIGAECTFVAVVLNYAPQVL